MSRLKGLSSLMILSMVWRSWHRKASIEIKTEISWFLEERYWEGGVWRNRTYRQGSVTLYESSLAV